MVVDDEPFLSVVGARLVWADDPEYLAFSEEHATRTRTRFTRAAPDPQHIVSNAAERAVRTVTGRLGGGSHPRILRADVIYRGRRAPEPFYLELDAVTQSPTGLSVLEVKMGRPKLRVAARKQLERFAKIAGVDLGPLNLVATIVLPVKAFNVLAGDSFGFRIFTVDNLFGRASVTISNFSAPIPEPSTVLSLLVLGGLGAGLKYLNRN